MLALSYFSLQVSYLIPKDVVPGRMGLLVTLFLCSINTLNSVASNSPSSWGNVSALVQWIIICQTFIIIAITEYAYILSQTKYPGKDATVPDEVSREQSKRTEEKANYLDKIMLISNPPIFISLAIIFWAVNVSE